jgi:predicted acetyltransferase
MSIDSLAIYPAQDADRRALGQMLELYQYELSDIWDQDLDRDGLYGYDVDRFWQDPNCTAYIATIGGNYAGFALVDDQVKVGGGRWWMDQFGVLKKYQRQGVGRALANYVFLDKIGKWEVGQMPDNDRSQAFWRQTIGDFTNGNYTECQITEGWWQGFVQCFESLPSN